MNMRSAHRKSRDSSMKRIRFVAEPILLTLGAGLAVALGLRLVELL